MLIEKWLTTFGKYLILMGRSFSRPEAHAHVLETIHQGDVAIGY